MVTPLCTELRGTFIPAPETAQAVVTYKEFGSLMENVLYFTKDGGWETADLQLLADTISAAWIANLASFASTDVSISHVRCVDMSSATGPVADNADTSPGTVASPGLPGNVTLAIKFTTAMRGKSYRGRMYFVGLDETSVEGQSYDPALLPDLIEAVTAFFAQIATDATCVHVVASYCQDKHWLETAVLTPVTGYSSDGFIDSQRRRLAGRGQ